MTDHFVMSYQLILEFNPNCKKERKLKSGRD